MVDLYKVLGVSPKASAAEIKSAYRRLARRHHPDMSQAPETAREFALISLAYRTLNDTHERAQYDQKLSQHLNGIAASVLRSDNVHARRLRVISMQARLDRAVDRWLEEERRENFALQQAVYPTVTLFLSTFFVLALRPRLWVMMGGTGRAILLMLCGVGLWHMIGRLRSVFAEFTYQPSVIHESIMDEGDGPRKPFSRAGAWWFLLAGIIISIGLGVFMGEQLRELWADVPLLFDPMVRPQLLLYPPIAVLLVDTMHQVAAKLDGSLMS